MVLVLTTGLKNIVKEMKNIVKVSVTYSMTYSKGNEFFFVNNSNIDASCLNQSKLYLIGKVHST